MPEERGRKARSIDRDAVVASSLTEEQDDTIACVLSVHDDDDGRENSYRIKENMSQRISRYSEKASWERRLCDDSVRLTSSQMLEEFL
jgi:hypothetical protein